MKKLTSGEVMKFAEDDTEPAWLTLTPRLLCAESPVLFVLLHRLLLSLIMWPLMLGPTSWRVVGAFIYLGDYGDSVIRPLRVPLPEHCLKHEGH